MTTTTVNGVVETEAAAPNVIEALRRVMRDLPAIGKDSKGPADQGGYAYRGIEAITAAAQGLCARHGVVFVPEVLGIPEVVNITVGGKPWTDVRMMVRYTVYGPGGAGDTLTVGPFFAIGRDGSDKGANKCMTQAYKYALLQVFMVADKADDGDGATPEADTPVHPDVIERRRRNAVLVQAVSDARQEVRAVFVPWKNDQQFPFVPGLGYELAAVDAMAAELERLDTSVPNPEQQQAVVIGACQKCGLPIADGEGVETDDGLLWHVEHAPQALPEPDPNALDLAPWDEPQLPITAAVEPAAASAAPGALPVPDDAQDGPPGLLSPKRMQKVRETVAGYKVAEVRNMLAAAGLVRTGSADIARERLIEHLFAQMANASGSGS